MHQWNAIIVRREIHTRKSFEQLKTSIIFFKHLELITHVDWRLKWLIDTVNETKKELEKEIRKVGNQLEEEE